MKKTYDGASLTYTNPANGQCVKFGRQKNLAMLYREGFNFVLLIEIWLWTLNFYPHS